jgi:cell division protein ZapE
MHLRDGLQTHATVRQRYDHLVEAGTVVRDAAQEKIAARLDHLIEEISARRLAQKSSALGWLFARKRETREPVKGLYIHGGVGRGKTMLMDMFFELVPVRRKRRVHFNAFMADAHDRIQKHRAARKNGETKEDDPIPPVARHLAAEAWVLCFDEFSVTDIADAMILSRLFSALFSAGVVLVATSNVAPQDLYKDGLNRQLFLPFISLLERNAEIATLDSDRDYRQEKLDRMPVYLTPDDAAAERAMDRAWAMVAKDQETAGSIILKGRKVVIPRAAGRAARFSFAELCDAPLGARDYLTIVERYDTIFIDHVPVLDQTRRNPTKRFILLIDTLYDKKVRVVISAETAPEKLYAGRAGVVEAFEFDRTASRLIEMQSKDWLDAWEASERGATVVERSPAT